MQKPALLRDMTPRLLRIYLFASLGAMNFGYDNNWWAGVNNMQTFIDDYGRKTAGGDHRTLPSTWLSAASGTPLAGWIVGCLTAGILTRRVGRKWTIIVICLVALIGMIIQVAVKNFWALVAGRLINAFSMGLEANCVPMYMAELAPSTIRGGLVGFYQCFLYVGAIIAAVTVYGSSNSLEGQWTYRTAIVVQLAPPCMLLAAVFFIPESPRWLISKGRKEKALSSLVYMRKGSGYNETEVSAELDLMDQAMQEEQENHRATSFADCFKGSNFRRTIIAIGVQTLQQAQGNSFTTTYLIIFLKQVGLDKPLLINVAKMCVNFGACVLNFYLSDKLGRRVMLMGGSFFMAALMWTISATSAFGGELSNSTAQGITAAILFYGAFASSCWGAVMWAVTTEVSTTQLRERTIALATTVGFITSLLITYINPFVQDEPGNLGARVGMIYGSISILSIAFVFFFVPEMKGRSLEELDELFHAKVPAWKAKNYVCTGIGARITDIQTQGEGSTVMYGKGVDEEERERDAKKTSV